MDKFREECGVFGIFGHAEASNLTYLGLYALQHRGQESAGIASSDGGIIRHHKAMGYVNEAFNSESLAKLPGSLAVGHVRYAPRVSLRNGRGPCDLDHRRWRVRAGQCRRRSHRRAHRFGV